MSRKNLKLGLATLAVLVSTFLGSVILAPQSAEAIPTTQFAATCQLKTTGLSAVLFPPWYKYLAGDNASGKCRPNFNSDQIGSTIVKIGSAVLELILNISAIVAVTFVIWGGIQYVISQGDPNGLTTAKSTITNALVGLVITVLASGIVQFVGSSLRS